MGARTRKRFIFAAGTLLLFLAVWGVSSKKSVPYEFISDLNGQRIRCPWAPPGGQQGVEWLKEMEEDFDFYAFPSNSQAAAVAMKAMADRDGWYSSDAFFGWQGQLLSIGLGDDKIDLREPVEDTTLPPGLKCYVVIDAREGGWWATLKKILRIP